MNISTKISVTTNVLEQLAYGTANQPVPSNCGATYAFTAGTGPGQTDRHYEQSGASAVTLAGGATITYTLSSLADDLGRSAAMAKVREYMILVTSRTAGDYLTVGNAATHPWVAWLAGTTPAVMVYDCLLLVNADGYPVVSGTSDQLLITNSGSHPITFTIVFNGTSV